MKKTIFIVGGSSGIGQELVSILKKDCNIIMASRNPESSTEDGVTSFTLDVTGDEWDLSALPETLDGFVYCPGSINLKPISRLKLDDFRNDFEINVIGAIKAVQKYLPQLKKGSHPSILLFSTVAAKLGMPFHASVAAAKSAVEGVTKSLGAELAPTIRVNAIAPTVTDTDLASKLLRNEKMIENIIQRHPLKKYLQPAEVADLATFLTSEKAKSISGQIFELDCGIVSFKI